MCRRTWRAGWEAVHVCVDDATRLAYVEVLADETATTTIGFVERAIAWFAQRGVQVRQLMSDNGAAYKSAPFATWCEPDAEDLARQMLRVVEPGSRMTIVSSLRSE